MHYLQLVFFFTIGIFYIIMYNNFSWYLFISIGIHIFHWYQNFIVISIGKMFQLQLKFKICNDYLQLVS